MIEIDKTKYQRLSWIQPNKAFLNFTKYQLNNNNGSYKFEIKALFLGTENIILSSQSTTFQQWYPITKTENKGFWKAPTKQHYSSYTNVDLNKVVTRSIFVNKTTLKFYTNNKEECSITDDNLIGDSNYFLELRFSAGINKVYPIFYYFGMYCTILNRYDYIIPVKQLSDNKIGLYNTFNKTFTEVTYTAVGNPIEETLDFSKVNKIVIPEGNVLSITKDGEENPLWSAKNTYAYGIKWTTGQKPTRIGNMNLHKTLPIQNNFKCCVHQGTDIKYYLNPNDSRFVEEAIRENFTHHGTEMNVTACDGLPNNVVSCEEDSIVKCKFVNTTLFSNYRFLYSYVYVKSNVDTNRMAIGRIVYIDTDKGEAYIDDSSKIQRSDYVYNEDSYEFAVYSIIDDKDTEFTEDCTIELGASLNGYDGELGVDTGAKFYQWSVDKEGKGNEVWISQYKCVPYAKEVKRHIIGCSRACVLNSAFNDAKWGWIGSISSNTSVNVINYNSRLRGGINNIKFDKYLGDDNFRCQLNKGRTNISLFLMRQYTQKLANHQVLYKQLWEAIVWCYCIEYCSLNVKNDFNNTLTTEGYHQGGLGQGYAIGGRYLDKYNNNECFTPCDYTLHLGNSTGIRKRQSKNFTFNTTNNLIWKNNIWTTNNVTWDNAVDNNNAKCKITKIAASNAILQAASNNVSGTITYKVEGLTNNQYIIFNREKGSLTITVDGTYVIEWGNGTANRRITFGIAQDNCEIYIEALSATDNYVNATQSSWEIPHWRGFNVFWYGDNWLNIENFLSKYDTTKQRRIYYWTDDVTKFDNSIDNKEHSLEDVLNVKNDWVNEFNLGKQGNLLVRSYGSNNYINTFHLDNVDTQVHSSLIGGQVIQNYKCSLSYLNSNNAVGVVSAVFGFVTCTIID